MSVTRLITVIVAVMAAAMIFAAAAVVSRPLTAPPADTVYLEELTWVEVRDAITAGKTMAIVPTGGVEQNGPQCDTRQAQLHRTLHRGQGGRIPRQCVGRTGN